jgi:hypothetical protein
MGNGKGFAVCLGPLIITQQNEQAEPFVIGNG